MVNLHTTNEEGEFCLKMGGKIYFSKGESYRIWPNILAKRNPDARGINPQPHYQPGSFFMVLLNIQKFAPLRLVIGGSRFKKALVRLQGSVDLSPPFLVDYTMRTQISWADSYLLAFINGCGYIFFNKVQFLKKIEVRVLRISFVLFLCPCCNKQTNKIIEFWRSRFLMSTII